MYALTKKQLVILIEEVYKNDNELIDLDEIKTLFENNADQYYHDYGWGAPWELTVENPVWKELRGQPGIPTEKKASK